MSQITISIVIPNYNHSIYLPKAISCALSQIEPAFEIIIIDDRSTDNSIAVIAEFIVKYPQVTLLQNESNQGVIYTINRGLREARGTHVLLAAADDWIEDTLLQHAKSLLEQHPQSGFWSSGSWVVYANKTDKPIAARMCAPLSKPGYIAPEQARRYLLKIDSWFMGNTLILNRELALQENGYIPELLSFTDNFLYRVLAAKYGCCFDPEKLATWRIAQQGYAGTFNVDPQKQMAVLGKVKLLLRGKYADVFAPALTHRIERRLSFDLARSIWNKEQGKVTNELVEVLSATMDNKFSFGCLLFALRHSGLIFGCRVAVGKVLLFLALRPFDLGQQLRVAARR
jgi:glycosyltransferase involved in cell wall biosynthesis